MTRRRRLGLLSLSPQERVPSGIVLGMPGPEPRRPTAVESNGPVDRYTRPWRAGLVPDEGR
jgi:hypothetical protein